MDENVIIDLKQFIAGAVTQQTSDIQRGIHSMQQDIQGMRQDIQRLDQKIDDGFSGVAEALEDMNTAAEMQYKDFDKRLVRQEQKAS